MCRWLLVRAAGVAAGMIVGHAVAAAGAIMPPPRVLYSTIPGHPTANVPGRPGKVFRNFWRPYLSPDGGRWVMRANSDFFDSGSLLLVGSGTTATAPIAQFDPAPWAPAEQISTVDEQCGVNDAGQVAFSSNTNGGPDATDEYVLRLVSSVYTVVAQEGSPVPSMAGVTYGLILDETHILADGRIGLRSINSPGLPSTSDTLLLLDGQLVAREGVTVPALQAVGGTQPWDNFDFQGYYHSSDGAHALIIGDLEGPTNLDGVAVVDGNVRIQEGSVIFPLTAPVSAGLSGFAEGNMATNGDWLIRGGNNNGQDWVVRNGVVLTTTGSAITPGATERFSDAVPNTTCYFLNIGSRDGDYVVGGYTDRPGTTQNAVLVYDGSTVVLRRGDALDLNGDGLANDDLFIADFEADKGALAPDGNLYLVIKVRNAAATFEEKALIRLDLTPAPCPADLDGDGQVGAADLAILLGSWGGGGAADLDGDMVVGAADLAILLGSWGPCP